jgi:hypothetical protein
MRVLGIADPMAGGVLALFNNTASDQPMTEQTLNARIQAVEGQIDTLQDQLRN